MVTDQKSAVRRGGDGGRGLDALRADLRAAVPDALAALAVTASVFLLLYVRVRAGTSDTVAVMPFMADANTYWMYFLSQAFGWAALLWAWLTVLLGLLLSGRQAKQLPLSRATVERLHRTTSLSTMALMFAHALLFAAELVRYETSLSWLDRFWSAFVDSFVPGGYDSGTGQIAIPIGLAALYLAIPLGLLFYVRHRIGARTWRILHRLIIVVYVLSVWHTLLYGTNVWYDGWPRTTLWLLQLPIGALLLLRLLQPARRTERLTRRAGGVRLAARLALVAAVLAAMGAVLYVVATGQDGGRERALSSAQSQPLSP